MNEQMGDRERLEDFLYNQKMITANYNTFAGECVCGNLRNDMLTILGEEHEIQNTLFTEMQTRGWYPTKQAEQKDLDTARQKFSTQAKG